MRKKLGSYAEKDMVLKDHTLVRCFQRGITREMIYDHLTKPQDLIDVLEQESRQRNLKKYKLVFSLSRNKSFILVITVNRKVYVVTAVIRYRKWVRPIKLRRYHER